MLWKLGRAIYRCIFWAHERGSWQYDIMAILILAFIFLTPRHWFGDMPTAPAAEPSSGVVLLENSETHKVYRLRAALLDTEADGALEQSALQVLRNYTGKDLTIIRIEPTLDPQGQVISYAVWVQE